MRAAVISTPGEPDVLHVQDVALPEVTADQVRVRVRAAGLNRADLLQRRGGYPAPAGAPAAIPGLEIAGVVEATGPLVDALRPGDRVFGIVGGGAHAEYVVTPQDLLAPVPASLSDVEAAAVPEVFMTAYDALFSQAGLRPGEQVLVHAAGSGVGTAAVQLARAGGATVYGTVRSEGKRQPVLALGVTVVFGPADFARQAQAAGGVDVLLDFVGAPYLDNNLEALAPRGRMVIIGLLGGPTGPINLGTLITKRLQIFGTVLRSRPRAEKATLTRLFASHVVPLLADGRVRPVVDRVFPLAEIAEAHRYMESNANFGKIVLQVAN